MDEAKSTICNSVFLLWKYLEGLVEVEAEVGKDDPELLPAVAVLELAQQVARQLVLQRPLVCW